MRRPSIDIGKLTPDERLDLIEELWDSLTDDERDSVPLTPEQERELDRRLEAYDSGRTTGISPDELRARIRRRVT